MEKVLSDLNRLPFSQFLNHTSTLTNLKSVGYLDLAHKHDYNNLCHSRTTHMCLNNVSTNCRFCLRILFSGYHYVEMDVLFNTSPFCGCITRNNTGKQICSWDGFLILISSFPYIFFFHPSIPLVGLF